MCIEPVAGGRGGDGMAALLWTLSPNLVLRCVAYRRPHALPAGGGGREQQGGGGNGGLGSLFDPLPRNEQAEALALRGPAAGGGGGDGPYPSCCAFVVGGAGAGGRYLVVGYPTGKVRTEFGVLGVWDFVVGWRGVDWGVASVH